MGAPNTETSSNKDVTTGYGSGRSTDGFQIGQTTGDYIGFYGTAPITQPAGVSKITDTSGGTASATTGMQALTSTYNSTLIGNSLSTIAAGVNSIYTLLHNYGLQSN